MPSQTDVLIVGGGLAGGLTALRLSIAKPDWRLLVIEGSNHLGGDHTWSFHDTDLSNESRLWISPLLSKSWTKHEIAFPKLKREFETGYHSIRSEDFHRVLIDRLGDRVKLGTRATELHSTGAVLESGEVIEARLVLDARGIQTPPPRETNGFQKFIGLDVTLESPHGLSGPILKDATCPQIDGYRFFYVLPWDERRLLIEETFYSDDPELNSERIERSIRTYAERKGWNIKSVDRIERGALPIPLTSAQVPPMRENEPLKIGMSAGYFHATTGYSLPNAVRVAEMISSINEPSKELALEALKEFRRSFSSKQGFYRLLNRLLFKASEPALRYSVLQRFYGLDPAVIERFYAGESTWGDRVRIMTGKPPVPLNRALTSMMESSIRTRGHA